MAWSGYASLGTLTNGTFVETMTSGYSRVTFGFDSPTASRVPGTGPPVTFTSADLDATPATVNAIAFYADAFTTTVLLAYPFVAPRTISLNNWITIYPGTIAVDVVEQVTADNLPVNLIRFATISGISGPGMVKLASGALANVSFFDLALPVGYAGFELRLIDINFNVPESPCAMVSVDGGATFVSDMGSMDTYWTTAWRTVSNVASSVNLYSDMELYLVYGLGQHFTLVADIQGGSVTAPFMVTSNGSFFDVSTLGYTGRYMSRFNPAATILPIPTGPVNAIRIGPYNYFSNLITSGSYILYGLQP